MAELDAIRELARECKREALAEATSGGVPLVSDVDPKYYARLEALLGRPYSEQEAYEFRAAFEADGADEQNGDGTAPKELASGDPLEGFKGVAGVSERPPMEYKGYRGSVDYSADDQLYHGRLLDLEGDLVGYEGQTMEELERAFQEAVDDYREMIGKKVSD